VQSHDLDDMEKLANSSIRNMMSKFKTMLDCERCGLFFVDDDSDELYFHVEEEGASIRFPKTKGIAGAVACSGEPLLIPDAYNDDRFNKAVDKITKFVTRNILCQPVKDGTGAVLAVVQMVNSRRDKGFTAKDQEKLAGYSKKVAVGLVAIRDADSDGGSAALKGSRMAKVRTAPYGAAGPPSLSLGAACAI
jgi:signal transduction protein with GAF and PtsI domain